MRIAIDGSIAQRHLGGISEYTHQMLTALGQIKTNHQFFVFTTGINDAALEPLPSLPANFREIRLRWPQRLLNTTWPRLGWPNIARFLPAHDVFWAPHFLLPAGHFSKLVVTIHDVLFLDHPEWFTPTDQTTFRQSVTAATKQADQIITVSEATKLDLIRHQLSDEKKVSVIPEGVIPDLPSEEHQARVRANYHLPPTYLLMIGTLEPRKNISRVLEAYEQLIQSGLELPSLILAGRRGWLSEELATALNRPAVKNRVRWLGSFDRGDKSALLAGAHALLFP